MNKGSLSCMEIYNLKSSGNIYFNFEEKFGVLPEFHFSYAIYHFEALEVKSPIV